MTRILFLSAIAALILGWGHETWSGADGTGLGNPPGVSEPVPSLYEARLAAAVSFPGSYSLFWAGGPDGAEESLVRIAANEDLSPAALTVSMEAAYGMMQGVAQLGRSGRLGWKTPPAWAEAVVQEAKVAKVSPTDGRRLGARRSATEIKSRSASPSVAMGAGLEQLVRSGSDLGQSTLGAPIGPSAARSEARAPPQSVSDRVHPRPNGARSSARSRRDD